MKLYIETLKRDFAKYGFVVCPLTDEEITTLYNNNVKLDEAYGIGCDVHAGFPFSQMEIKK